MIGAKVSGCASAVLAVGALVVSLALPRSLSEIPLPPAPEGASTGPGLCAISIACPPPLPNPVQAHLASRAPALAEYDRGRVAATIVEEAARARLDPLFVLALIEVESGYDPSALSERGARGLMQLLPSTLRREAARSRLLGDDPSDPVLNVKAGVRYYQRLLRVFGSQDLALMAYNAGPNRINGYLKSGGIPDRFREYPRRVRAELRRLRSALGTKSLPLMAVRERGPVVERAAE